MIMKMWMAMLCFVVAGVRADSAVEKEYNKRKHDALCDFLKAAVSIYQSKGGNDAMQKALTRTIFGNEGVEDLERFKRTLPEYYSTDFGKNRANVCGQSYTAVSRTDPHPRWPGHSAPHDLLCLCTVGEGWESPLMKPVGGSIPFRNSLGKKIKLS
ncbi:unnamed protein product [Trypanosoma congolense IL3000]|uniref:WGS project CAEQ00000000 data, annotated contig 181 n=1 Tax=Trypanosoma congolense (strain IL3000) TaxID=1068625 RepID=F9W931_TRYCI|nr:unnamed protein product [Trypanosoma congolense IL3000]